MKIALRGTFLKLLENPLEHLAAQIDSFNCLSHLEVHNLFQDTDFLFKYQQVDCLLTLAAETPVIMCAHARAHTHTHTHTQHTHTHTHTPHYIHIHNKGFPYHVFSEFLEGFLI